jgi:histidyl-tRNA synthetase
LIALMASSSLQPIQGMSDISAPDVALWQFLESTARRVLRDYAYTELRTPVVERTELFQRSLGDATDVVQKEMYSFEDRGGRHLSLRPEGTAGAMRYVAAQGQDAQDARLFYIGPMFRSERPQAGRRRQFHQLGVECISTPSAAVDAETIALQAHLLRAWGLTDYRIEINTRGEPEDAARVAAGLREAVASFRSELCEDCQRRFDANPLRMLDCKQPRCRELLADVAPVTTWMSAEARRCLDDVVTFLEGLEIPVDVNPRLVRGLDYYMHTVWEVTHTGLGAQDALSGGGRYRLTIGGRDVEGVGFAMGLERVIAALQAVGAVPADLGERPDVWLVAHGEAAFAHQFRLMQSFRQRGIACGMDLQGRSVKAQMKAANRSGATWVVIRGDDEIEQGVFQLKHMEEGTQQALELPALMDTVKQTAQQRAARHHLG